MRDIGSTMDEGNAGAGGYVSFALDVIEHLARRRRTGVGVLDASLVETMITGIGSADPGAMAALIDALQEARVSDEQIIDGYIPECARRLGRAWEEDRMSFAAVTLGVGRLQHLLHLLAQDATADAADPFAEGAVLLIVPPGEQHTLGAMVVASQLRRQGISVCLRYAPGLLDLSMLLDSRRFDAALITIGSEERLEICRKLVNTLSQLGKGTLRIAVGGPVGETCRGPLLDGGAHLVTNDLAAVVAQFGLGERKKARHAG
jgi:methylmalonyl-CoA mutase cobalamin-binding subunit